LPNALNLKKNWGTALRNVVTAEWLLVLRDHNSLTWNSYGAGVNLVKGKHYSQNHWI
jgi:hypothetical protein